MVLREFLTQPDSRLGRIERSPAVYGVRSRSHDAAVAAVQDVADTQRGG